MLTGHPYVSWLFMGLLVALVTWVLLRCGLLAVTTLFCVRYLLLFPITENTNAWYFGNGLIGLSAIVLLAVFGCYASLGGRSLFWDTFVEND